MINWKRLIITSAFVIFSSALLGFLMWQGLSKVIAIKEQEISVLQTRQADLSRAYAQELDAKKAQEATSSSNTNTNSRSSNSNSAQEESSSPEPQAQSQIYYFYNPSCGACKLQTPIVTEVQNEGVPFVWCNIIDHPEYIGQYSITATPTFILNGNRRNFSTKAELENFWNTYK